MTPEQKSAYDMREQGMSRKDIAQSLGISESAVKHRLERARKWLNADPQIAQTASAFGVGDVAQMDHYWRRMPTEDGGFITGHFKNALAGDGQSDILADIADAFKDIPAAPSIIKSEKSKEGKMGFFPHSDVHIGVDITEDRGGVDYTPEIAIERLKDGFSELHGSIPTCETTIILNNGDLTHANDDRDVTFKSQHKLKVKGSHRTNLSLAVAVTDWQIQMALNRSDRVIYRANRGNHDPNTPDVMAIALGLRYANEPRVTIDKSEREIWVYQKGLLFLSAWHGDKRKPEQVCSDIPGLFPDKFGSSRFWYGFTGHYHGPKSGVYGAINWWQLPSVCSPDQHSSDANYTDDAAMRAMMFCERGGLKHDMTVRF